MGRVSLSSKTPSKQWGSKFFEDSETILRTVAAGVKRKSLEMQFHLTGLFTIEKQDIEKQHNWSLTPIPKVVAL